MPEDRSAREAFNESVLDGLDLRRDGRYDAFGRIGEAKKRQILDAAIGEFADNDYEQASTNEIVRKAGISKGLLFRYFGDKEGLFVYLVADVATNLFSEIGGMVDLSGSDIFEVLTQATIAKTKAALSHSAEVRFYTRSMHCKLPGKAAAAISGIMRLAMDNLTIIEANLDEKLLKDGLEKDKAIKIIDWACRGCTEEIVGRLNADGTGDDYEELVRETNGYFEFMKKLFYK